MKLSDGTILKHGPKPYDPAKAHEYYLRIRKLKGRKPGQHQRVGRSSITKSPTFTVKLGNGKTIKLNEQQLSERQAYAAERVRKIKGRLAELNNELNKRMAEARKRKSKTKQEAQKAPTAAEKSKAARESKQYRQKHRQELAVKGRSGSKGTSAKSKPDSVAVLEKKIVLVKGRLIAAVAKQRELATATKG